MIRAIRRAYFCTGLFLCGGEPGIVPPRDNEDLCFDEGERAQWEEELGNPKVSDRTLISSYVLSE